MNEASEKVRELEERLAGAEATVRVHEHTIRLVSAERDKWRKLYEDLLDDMREERDI